MGCHHPAADHVVGVFILVVVLLVVLLVMLCRRLSVIIMVQHINNLLCILRRYSFTWSYILDSTFFDALWLIWSAGTYVHDLMRFAV